MEQEVGFVTDDKWMRVEGGQLDKTDRDLLKEASQNGRLHVKVMNMRGMLEHIQNSEPKKYRDFKKELERQSGKRLTFKELVEFGRKADERLSEFNELVSTMTLGDAVQIRRWRVDCRMTWRSVARAVYLEGWFGRNWEPASNQIMGMALTDKAAQLFGENFREAPWN